MTILRLFTDGSVNPKSKVGYGAYLAVLWEIPYSEAFKADVKVKKFEHTSSAKLELQALIWALTSVQKPVGKIIVYTDSQNIIGLKTRRRRLEINDYLSKKKNSLNKNRNSGIFYGEGRAAVSFLYYDKAYFSRPARGGHTSSPLFKFPANRGADRRRAPIKQTQFD